MPDDKLLDLTDEEIGHYAGPVREAYERGGATEVVVSLYQSGLLAFGDYGDRAHLRASWAAMSGCLIKLSKRETLDPNLLAQVPESHRSYLLGHAAMHQQNAEMGRRLRAAEEALGVLMTHQAEAAKDAVYAVIQVLRGETREVMPVAINGCDDCSVEPGETHRYASCPGALHARSKAAA